MVKKNEARKSWGRVADIIDENKISDEYKIIHKSNYAGQLNAKAQALTRLGRYKDALKYWDKILELEPDAKGAVQMREEVLGKLKKKKGEKKNKVEKT